MLSTLGLRHLAINVKNPEISKEFYMKLLGMKLHWQPDPNNIYLSSNDMDILALHKGGVDKNTGQFLDHMGFFVKKEDDLYKWYDKCKEFGAKIKRDIKKHRDGSSSFYLYDPDGIVIQMLYNKIISNKSF